VLRAARDADVAVRQGRHEADGTPTVDPTEAPKGTILVSPICWRSPSRI
jgi:hypothetical protein